MIGFRERRRKTFLGAGVLSMFVGGCASPFVTVAPTPPEKYERLGAAEGRNCGALLVLASAYNFIPAGLNDRVAAAYQSAVASVPGATALVNVTYQEDWYWWLIGSSRCVTVKGEAIK